ncbi:Beige/BEACH domain containing protein [Trichomonas vaginalis G3]|uniref:Beige/BEACH domain containing protein n=1 Tax=Trichomonas vaginalis (strain ATCC PRA-98 / G3) TaxID=412133 RepID=A2FHU9_TRIV3|nr:beige/BEACH-related family [Trichomonas vaginalis G3]EAX95522.1 Beige/BEACH domain containing protein [Trichomonas vaginalis G3]KAI5495025.1 beige/BEACH-related family [Trichomonas vaginalis G3]|eukprot:XP_001308452.1 Beige/BEACH domain containing protein [Trichomonas vaginalis G3]
MNELLITALLSAASGQVFEEVTPKIIIKTPIFIKVMCEIYIDTESASNIFILVQNMCKFSRDNAKLCHKIGIDMLLLSFINKKKFDKYLPKSYVPALELLSCIATVSSSTPVVSSFISLFCPDSTKHLSQYHSIFIDRMIMLIKDNSNPGELSFKEVLFRFCKPQIILPLFAQLDLQFVDDMPLPPYSDAITHLLSSILVASPECQISFYESHGFKIICYLLLQANPSHLTPSLYDSFVSLFEKINNLDLKSVLFESILSNILLWSRSTHSTAVLPSLFTFCSKNEKLSQKYMIFQEITLKTNILFYYTAPIRAIPKFQISKLDPAIRYMIEKFLFDTKRNKFTSDDINFLVSQCLVLEDRQVFADTLRMLELVLESNPKPYLPQDLESVMNLHQLFSSGDMCVTIDLIDFMIKLHKIKPLYFSCSVHANIIANLLPDSLICQKFLNRLIEKSEKVQEYVPLVFYIASKGSLNYSGLFTKRPKPIESTFSDWAFWPCVCAVINGITKAGSILDYLVACFDKQDFQILFNTLSIVCEIIGVDKEPFLRSLLEKQIFYVLTLNNQEIAGKIFDFAICQIFFRKTCMSSQISRVFSSSDYELSQYMDDSKDEIGEFPSSRRIIAVLEKIIKREDKFVFGISLNKDENWDDMNIPVILNELRVSSTSQMRSRALAISFAFAMQTDMKDAAKRILMTSKDNGLISEDIDLSSDEIQCQKLKVSTNNSLKEFIDEYMPLVLQNEKNYKLECQRLFDFIKSSKQIFERHFTMFDLSLVVRAKKDIDTLIENFESTTNENRKYWYRTWNILTFDRAPWVSALPVIEKHYKRDSNLYGLQIPCKLKVNKKFDDHKLASLKRDLGSKDAAEQIYENMNKNKLSNGTEIIKDDSNEKEEYDTNKVIEIECELITVKKSMKSRFLLSSDTLSILNLEKTIHVKSNQVKLMLFRLILHKPHGIEIFLKSGKTFLINIFKNSLNFLKTVSRVGNWGNCLIQTIPMEQFFQQQKVTETWVSGQRSNFAYLMALNIFSGRSFNDLSMYPVFPWTVKDFESEILDLQNSSIFRDLSKPIGAIGEKRLSNLKEHAESLEEIGIEPYLYASCFVSPLTVILWLIRIEPFTSLHVDIQGGKFDHPHRIFSSLKSAYQQSTNNDNDFRELIPEFYFSPEFLLNSNGFDFGILNGKQINDVELPNWAKNNPYKFVYLHRKCLESDYVSSHLNDWIDLIWGCKQNSPDNKYLPGMYSDIYQKIPENEPRKLKEIENVKKLIGQIPPQLFDKPHPVKKNYVNPKAVKSEVKSHIDVKSDVIFTYFANKDIGVQGFTVLSDGSISRILLNTFSKDILSISLSSRFKTVGNCFSFCLNSQLFLMAKEDGHITIIDCGMEQTTIELERHIGSVNCLSVDGNYMVSGGNDTAINVWNLSKNREKILILFSLPTFRAEIVSIDVCQSFGICAALTSDGALFIVSINYGDVRKIVDLGRNPTKVIISKSWCFIAVFSSAVIESKSVNFLTVYSINGEKLNENELNFDVSCVCTMTTPKGFDYLIICDTNGNIFLSETFYANVELIFRKKVNNIVSISYLNERDCICFATKDGTIGVIPFTIENKL